MKASIVAVCDPGSRHGFGPVAMHVHAVLPGAAVVQYAEERPAFPPPDVLVVVVDPRLGTLPGALPKAHIVVVDDVLTAPRDSVAAALSAIGKLNGEATVIQASSAPRLEPGPSLMDTAVLVVEDGPSSLGPGTLAAVDAEVGMRVDPRPFAVGSLVETYRRYPELGAVLPVMAYDRERLAEVETTIDAVDCDAVVDAAGIDLAAAIAIRHPVRRVVRELREVTAPTLAEALRLSTQGDSVSSPMHAASPRPKLVASK